MCMFVYSISYAYTWMYLVTPDLSSPCFPGSVCDTGVNSHTFLTLRMVLEGHEGPRHDVSMMMHFRLAECRVLSSANYKLYQIIHFLDFLIQVAR